MEHLEYVERESARNMDFHLENMECLQKESQTTLTFLYAVIAASFAGAVKMFESGTGTNVALALCVLCAYLSGLGVFLVFGCLTVRIVKAPTNEPANLMLKEGYSSDEIRQFELENLQQRIEFNRKRNDRTGSFLNWCRVLICLSPVLFGTVLLLLVVIALVLGRPLL